MSPSDIFNRPQREIGRFKLDSHPFWTCMAGLVESLVTNVKLKNPKLSHKKA
jgi:hypothetical protein